MKKDVEIILPRTKVPAMKEISKYLIGFGVALMFAGFVSLMDCFAIMGFVVFIILMVSDKGFRGRLLEVVWYE